MSSQQKQEGSLPKYVSLDAFLTLLKGKQSPDESETIPSKMDTLFWRIVFTQSSFVLQVTNNFGGPRLSWITVSNGEEEVLRIPENYLLALRSLGTSPLLFSREVVEKHAVPRVFASYSEVRAFALETMGLPPSQEWHPESKPVRAPGILSRLNDSPFWVRYVVDAIIVVSITLLTIGASS